MNQFAVKFISWMRGDPHADRVVPPTGFTAYLTILTSAAMALLAVFALAVMVASGQLADRWTRDLAQSATVRISAPAGQVAAQTEAALEVLRTTPGVAAARVIPVDEQRALLQPWFGDGVLIDRLRLPQLIDIEEQGEGPDMLGLRQRLAGEAPGAVLDDHARWRAPLLRAAVRLRAIGVVALLLIGAVMAAMITLAAQASLVANAQVIGVLRLVGALDSYIARAFVRRFTLRATLGAAVGAALGMIVIALWPSGADNAMMSTDGLRGASALWVLCIPPVAAAVAWAATRWAAHRMLKGMA